MELRSVGTGGVAGGPVPYRVGQGRYAYASDVAVKKIVKSLKETDLDVRAKLKEEAKESFGAPRYFNTRGPDNGLYAVDGLVLAPVKSNVAQPSVSKGQQPAEPAPTFKAAGEKAPEVPAARPAPAPLTYSPTPAQKAPAISFGPSLGGSADFTA